MTKKELSVFDKHRLKIAKSTLKMSDAIVGVMGGMNKAEARRFIIKLYGKTEGTSIIRKLEK